MDTKRWPIWLGLLGALAAGVAEAKDLVRDDFRDPAAFEAKLVGKASAGEEGWATELAVRVSDVAYAERALKLPSDLSRGAIAVSGRRKAVPAKRNEGEMLWAFRDPRGAGVVRLYAVFEDAGGSGQSAVYLRGGFGSERRGMWNGMIPLGRTIQPGETWTVTLTWDDGRKEYRAFYNGVELKLEPIDYREGRLVRYERATPKVGFASLLARASSVRLGGYTRGEGVREVGDYHLRSSTLLGFRISTDPSGSDLAITSVAAEKTAYGIAQEVVVTLKGTADKKASFTLPGVGKDVAMNEVDDGVYVGRAGVAEGSGVETVPLTGTLTDPRSRAAVEIAGPKITLDRAAPAPVGRILADCRYGGEIEVGWEPSRAADLDHYAVYRSVNADPSARGEPFATTREPLWVDARVTPGLTYKYVAVPVDRAGNAGPPSAMAVAKATPPAGSPIRSVTAAPADRPLRPGAVVTVALVGSTGAAATADLEGLAAGIPLAEQGRSGTYVGTYTVAAKDVGTVRAPHLVVGRLVDPVGEGFALAGPELAVIGQDGLNDTTPPAIARVTHDGWYVAGNSGKLVAGDVVSITVEGEPGGYGSFLVPGAVGSQPLAETSPGVYAGTFTVPRTAEGLDVPVIAELADEAGNVGTLRSERGLAFDTRVRLSVRSDKALLPADRTSEARLVARAEDANGNGLEGHELALALSTTEEYTGVVGGGSVEGRQARMEDEDDLEVRWGGETDGSGEVKATYRAGFAAKTALLVAKDLTTGDVGAGWLNTYVASTVAVELIPRSAKGAADRAVMRMTANPAKLTADGRSTSRVKVFLADLGGSPLAGAAVAFALGNENGRLKVLRGTTDEKGLAEAEYRAGTAAGLVTVTASSEAYGVTATAQILLLADAPAKIDLAAAKQKLVADGKDETSVSFRVSDIHDNPNPTVPVALAVLKGSGRLSSQSLLTDRYGEGRVTLTAGSTPGTTVVEARHTSRAPTEEELRRVYGTVFVPRLYERQERDRVTLTEWLVEAGDAVEKGASLAVLDTRDGEVTLFSPAKGVFTRAVKHARDRVELGETLGYVEVDAAVWKEDYGR